MFSKGWSSSAGTTAYSLLKRRTCSSRLMRRWYRYSRGLETGQTKVRKTQGVRASYWAQAAVFSVTFSRLRQISLETRDMRPRHRLAVLATLSLLGAGLWWVSVIAPPGDTVPDDAEAAERSGPQGLSQ